MQINALSFLAATADHHIRETHRIVSTGIGMVLANMGERCIEFTPESIAEFTRQYDVATEKTAAGGVMYRLIRKAPEDAETKNLPI